MGDLYFQRPISNSHKISSPFNSRDGEHRGIDYEAPIGIKVVASERGLVVRAAENPKTKERKRAYGNVVVIDHTPFAKEIENHIYSLYAHLDTMSVSAGDIVEKGKKIGRSGNTGMSSGPHLHFEILDVKSKLGWRSSRGAMGVHGVKTGGKFFRKNPRPFFTKCTTIEGTIEDISLENMRNPLTPNIPTQDRWRH
jgi:murein DD-endopeptidase MepM/ murein hydrolase activator NlpD